MTKTERAFQDLLSRIGVIDASEIVRLRLAFRAGIDVSRSRQTKTDIRRKLYTKQHLDLMREMRAAGVSYSRIAEKLGRSMGSIKGTLAYYSMRNQTNGSNQHAENR